MTEAVAKKESALRLFLQKKRDDLKRALEESADGIKNVREKRIAVLTLGSAALLTAVVCYFTLGKKLLLFLEDRAAFKEWLTGFGPFGKAVFVAVRAVQTVVKIIPGEPLEIGAGYAFGTWGGLFYCMLGTFLGSLVIIALTKKFGVKLVELFVPKKKIDSLAFLQNRKNLNATLFIIYLIPSTPKDIITYLICLTDESIPLFLLITMIGRIPSIITSTWCGASLEGEHYLGAAVIFLCTAVVGLGGGALYSRIAAGKTKQKKTPKLRDGHKPQA